MPDIQKDQERRLKEVEDFVLVYKSHNVLEEFKSLKERQIKDEARALTWRRVFSIVLVLIGLIPILTRSYTCNPPVQSKPAKVRKVSK